ncbi:hypothetical protein L202_02175 [Cryptococcus amylolentus CBS 6039]|uniref:GRIP domain-containing protein n=2 Tax=Cryptococcus amylolentus TaxID=104669 RepID=A0A1E3I1U6_9TREE|nr:hypothetical protein L202_02175 [Cryptococcus amylolentus CBS 6039]ODN81811.1 hypothetical protein L202_02175 [Cryptococcus amylolentus CBS 6039]ODO10016.1 hypothetical protein I350_02241 [Cryptococcus amylolentus CBS 6273]
MFGVSLQDRLKAAVNTLEATGSSLHARSLANQQLLDAENNRPGTPSIKSPPSATSPQVGQLPETPQKGNEEKHAIAEAGIHPSVSTSQLAENALSGLRRSFHFGGKSQTDLAGIVDGSSSAPVSPGAQGLKAIVSPGPASAGATSSDSTSLKAPTTIFNVGSGDASEAITPIPKSPLAGTPTPTRSAKRILDTREPADIPLPPSPDLSAVPSASVVDPLGALSLDGSGDVAGLGIALAGGAGSDADAKANGDETLVDSEGTASKLAAAERRYEDLSQRFTTLLTQSHKANQILKDLTPLEGGLGDPEALEGWVRMMNGKVGMMGEEMSRLASKMELQESRIEELRDTHRLEQSSQSEVIAKLRSDLADAQSKITSSTTSSETLTQLRADLSKAQTQAKEEEEKRTKAISLLKTVRLKLVKTEKDKEELEKDRANERAERSRAMDEVEKVKAEREREVNNLRKGFERELAGVKEKAEKDLKDRKADWELEMITTKATQAKELSQKSTKIAGLESILKELNIEKQQTHSVLQSKQAEAESAKAEMEIMRTKTKEFEWQLREAEERCALLEAGDQGRSNSELDIPGGRSESTSPGPGASPHDVQRLLAESESRAESKLSDLRARIRALEKERNEMEEEWAGKVQERVLELEKMRRVLQEKDREYAESLEGLKERERKIEEGESKVKQLEADIIRLRTKVEEVKSDKTVAVEAERKAHEELAALQNQITSLQSQLDESRTHVTHLKSTNKTLRDEMRKIQSSVQLMERQRNPGVGYWSAGAGGSTGTAAGSSVSVAGSGVLSPPLPSESPAPGRKSLESVRTTTATDLGSESGRNQEEEEVNLEYLRNVILQFLEHKEMRPNLVRVMSVILRFTPQELRRLNAKLLT